MFGWSGAQSDGWRSHLFSRLLMLISCHVCSRCICGALPLILARSFPPLHSHALMRALAFTLHRSSPLSLVFVSAVRVPRHSSTLSSSSPPPVPSCHPPTSITYTFSPSNLIFLTSFMPSPCRPLSVSHTPFLPYFPAVPPFIPAFSVRTPPSSSSHHLSLFHPCQPALTSDAR